MCGQVVNKLCVSASCVMGGLCVDKLYVDKLCVDKVCVDKLCDDKLCVDKLCVCVMGGWRREAAEAAGYRTKNKNPTQRCREKTRF